MTAITRRSPGDAQENIPLRPLRAKDFPRESLIRWLDDLEAISPDHPATRSLRARRQRLVVEWLIEHIPASLLAQAHNLSQDHLHKMARTKGRAATGNEYEPDHVSHPSETVREVLQEQNLGWTCLSDGGLYSVHALCVYRGTARITEAVAYVLANVTGIPERFWLNRQRLYDRWKRGVDS